MTSIKSIISGLAEKGKVLHEVVIQDTKFEMRTISTEEQFLAETMSSVSNLKNKYKSKTEINSYMDTLAKMRNLAILSFVIKSVDGIDVVAEGTSPDEAFQKRLEFRDDLSGLPTAFIDELLVGYNELYKKNKELYKDLKENLGK